MEKILFDTDIGSDIDDALALAYLLKEPRCDLLGITTVTAFPELRASMVSAVCRNAGRDDIPIHAGCGKSLLIEAPQQTAAQAEAIGDWSHEKFSTENTAVDFLYQTIIANPGEITLLGVGPMTNIGLLFAMYPDIASKLKSLVLMCGHFAADADSEWNARNDPHAAAIVYGNGFQSKPPLHYSCGLDVTTKCRLNRDEGREKFKNYSVLAPVRDFAEVWFKASPVVTFHDPLAAVCIFEPDVCTWKDTYVEVPTFSEDAGKTIVTDNSELKCHKIAEEVDSKRFFQIYFDTISD
ncbi:MAG: nucleoside hydrolase [Lentisphaerae bacterium]|jgi:purine nucleosidase|nr:nucleoside hydrolase [Lentisphaerota bacterium]